MNDPYQQWTEREAAQMRSEERQAKRDRHTPPETVAPVTYAVTCPASETRVQFDTIQESLEYARSVLIGGFGVAIERIVPCK